MRYIMSVLACTLAIVPPASGQTPLPGLVRASQTEVKNTATSLPTGKSNASLDAETEKRALRILLKSVQKEVVSAADAMPAVKYQFAPTEGEFRGVRSFGQQVKHLSATNHILAAAALGEDPPTDAGDEQGPESVRSKPEILAYLNDSFAHLERAIDAIGKREAPPRHSPISPMPESSMSRIGFTVEALIHAFNHYGQMVEYLRLNGIVPPASQP